MTEDFSIRDVHFSDAGDIDEYLNGLWLELGDIRKIPYTNKLENPAWENREIIPELMVRLARDPDYLHFTCKYILNVELAPYQIAILQLLWTHPLPFLISSRGGAKSFMLSVYYMLRSLMHQGCKIIIIGSALRQSLVLYNYMEYIWENAPILRDIVGKKNHPRKELHAATWECGLSKIMFLPMGTGDKIRGLRGNYVGADEIASISPEIFETVVRGFAAVKSDGLIGHIKSAYKEREMKRLGLVPEADVFDPSQIYNIPGVLASNQIIMAGTASYQFNHTYKYYLYYRAIIQSCGDRNYLKREFPDMPVPDAIRPQDYCLIRLPFDKLPPGMIDESILMQGRATMDPLIFNQEMGACFSADSNGFYLASQLHHATCPVDTMDGKIIFGPRLYGNKEKRHVMGIDPASENDNFAICIIEINDTYRAVVYVWSTNRKDFETMEREGVIDPSIKDYNSFLVWHIRSLCKRFNIVKIMCDASGGGLSLREGLKDPSKVGEHELPILDIDDPYTDRLQGNRILSLINFADAEWRTTAHHGLKKDIMDKVVIFPMFDLAEVESAKVIDSKAGKSFDTLEDAYLEIEQCKTETTLIRYSRTPTGQEKWDIPRLVGVDIEDLRRRLKRDRFTSLLLANWGCRDIKIQAELTPNENLGTFLFTNQDTSRMQTPDEITGSDVPRGAGGRRIFY